jgi:hypothetical protein
MARGKGLAKLIGGGRDVRVQRNKMGSLEGLLLSGASRREWREWRGKGRKKYGEIGELKVCKRYYKK